MLGVSMSAVCMRWLATYGLQPDTAGVAAELLKTDTPACCAAAAAAVVVATASMRCRFPHLHHMG
jgi:hypothetical protein